MPLPSVEAASREGAIAAARERYGSSVRIVGIRRVRTGGVMGFFSTERFVAEVEEPPPAPVERRPASRAESMARIEAALRRDPVLPDPVDEVADLLGGGAGRPAAGLYSRASAARSPRPAAGRGHRPAAQPAAAPAPAPAPVAVADPAPAAAPAPEAPLPPSPFTAALAQMVAGDVDVREAVDEAIAAVAASTPAPVAAVVPPAPAPVVEEPAPAAPAPAPVAAVAPPAPAPRPATAPPAPPGEPVPVPEWVHEPDFATGPITSREEAIAEVLRAALAHDTSEAALTQLLRGVLAGSPPAADTDDAWDDAHTAEIPVWVDATAEADEWEVAAEVLAPTASDPAPLPADATTVLPPLSLLPPPAPGTALAVPPLLGRPPVPPSTGHAPGQSVARLAPPTAQGRLATVTRLPVDKRAAASRRSAPMVVPSVRGRSTSGGGSGPLPGAAEESLIGRLLELGVPEALLGEEFAVEVARRGAYAALTRALAAGLPAAPAVPTGAGEVLLVVGPGVETLAAARALAASLRLDGEQLQWASRGDLAALAPRGNRITSIDTALERRQEADRSSALTIVAVDVPLRAGGGAWLEQMVAVFAPVGVWAVVEATRKPEDVGPWLDALPRVDALMVQDTDLTADPAAVLGRTTTPVALLDGARATAHRWASLLCERLEGAGA
ncbi:hypothetical protein SAMN06893096_10742 [Geodermatophilus pulveris]|uniref:Meckel syndrome type 1 protein n=1 Tax=Geodermatophilus pulveris TaxID=1564159 RepID=A0A239GSG0_9ACTN|nr:hypothetical protein [Geodermatophilus pulveris]SNS72149.1 hypothetical protein SAMN06893096_10742 [Geodermatophilus pulveris]